MKRTRVKILLLFLVVLFAAATVAGFGGGWTWDQADLGSTWDGADAGGGTADSLTP
jgi:hypothetical protein